MLICICWRLSLTAAWPSSVPYARVVGVSTARLKLLDLFCGVGGAGMGYHLAGFDVTGVDIAPQPRYPFPFIQGDAIEYLKEHGHEYGMIHASPPCQERNSLTVGTNRSRGWGRKHIQLVPDTRKALETSGVPYVIEQPTGHGGLIRCDVRLCMDMFRSGPPPWVQRHRDFEISGFTVKQPVHPKHEGRVRGMRHGQVFEGPYVAAYGSGGGKANIQEMRHALVIPWAAERSELTEAIPPAYTCYIGTQILKGHQ